jgi:hypothetical protein
VFDVPGFRMTETAAMNGLGQVTGAAVPCGDGPDHGFLRDPDGQITVLQVTNAFGVTIPTSPAAIDLGQVAGRMRVRPPAASRASESHHLRRRRGSSPVGDDS